MELKEEITQIVNALPSEILGDVLLFLKQVEKTSTSKMQLSLNLKTILLEDQELLEKLAKWLICRKFLTFIKFWSRNSGWIHRFSVGTKTNYEQNRTAQSTLVIRGLEWWKCGAYFGKSQFYQPMESNRILIDTSVKIIQKNVGYMWFFL